MKKELELSKWMKRLLGFAGAKIHSEHITDGGAITHVEQNGKHYQVFVTEMQKPRVARTQSLAV